MNWPFPPSDAELGTAESDPPQVYRLRRPPMFSGRLVPFLLVTGMVGIAFLTSALERVWSGAGWQAAAPMLIPAVVLLGLAGLVVGRRRYARSRPDPTIALHTHCLTLPQNIESLRLRDVPYHTVRSFVMGGPPGLGRVLIETERDVFVFSETHFVRKEAPLKLLTALRARIEEQPQGQAQLAGMRERQSFSQRAVLLRPWVTQVLIGLNLVFYANQFIFEAQASTPLAQLFEPIRWGALSGPLVDEGEYFRLFAANFLHRHPLHIGLNMFGLYLLGYLLERLLGSWRFLWLYLASGLTATVCSWLLSAPPISLGASGAVFGLLGGLAAANLKYGHELPLGFRQPRKVWAWLLGANVALPALVYVLPLGFRIDVAAHGGGFIAGLLVCGAYFLGQKNIEPNRACGLHTKGAALIAALCFGAALGKGVAYASQWTEETYLEVASKLEAEATPEALNNHAWLAAAINPQADRSLLEQGLTYAQRAVEAEPDQPAFIDTLATVQFRLGHFEEAIALEAKAMAMNPGPVYASQLARFLAAEQAAQQTPASKASIELRKHENRPVLYVQTESSAGVELDVPVGHGAGYGLLRIQLPTGQRSAQLETLNSSLRDFPIDAWPALKVGRVRPWSSEGISKPVWYYWEPHPEIVNLPPPLENDAASL